MKYDAGGTEAKESDAFEICNARCMLDFDKTVHAAIEIRDGKIERLRSKPVSDRQHGQNTVVLDLSDYIVVPGLINAHDHLEFALYPRVGNPPYRNYVEWGEDIHAKYADVIVRQKKVPRNVRLWWGGIRNLLCGVTTVCHHNPLWPELKREDFPVRVVQDYGWCHSVALGEDIIAARTATPTGRAFIVHASEGVDELARNEPAQLDAIGLLDEYTVLVHGLAIDDDGVGLLNSRRASLVLCPSSNEFLFDRVPDSSRLLRVDRVALGSDSPLTSIGDLLDEIQFAIRSCGIGAQLAFDMVTNVPAQILRLGNGEGCIQEGGRADLVGVRDTGAKFQDRLHNLSMKDIEFVMIGGRVQLASGRIVNRLPPHIRRGLEPLSIDGMTRWLRAPAADLVRITEEALGGGCVKLGSREVSFPMIAEAEHAC